MGGPWLDRAHNVAKSGRKKLRVSHKRESVKARSKQCSRHHSPHARGMTEHTAQKRAWFCSTEGRFAPSFGRIRFPVPNLTMPRSQPPQPSRPVRLVDVLRQLPSRELESLIGRLKIRIDEAKRLDVPSQVARLLLQLPELRDPSILPGPTRELLFRIAESGGVLAAKSLPAAVEPLVARGVVFARAQGAAVELLLPIACLLQMKPWEGEDPRGVRAMLWQAHPDVAASVAAHYLGRPATPPLALCLEPAWEVLSDPERLAREVTSSRRSSESS